MASAKKAVGKIVFGLDIGTRSVVGTVGYKKGDEFFVMAQCIEEHTTRSMLDGQIHDILQVGETITHVKEALEKECGQKLKDVCIAAAGRVLRTVTVHSDLSFETSKTVTNEDIYSLRSRAIELAYEEITKENTEGETFYCVGSSVIRYYMNGFQIGNLEEHKASSIGADLIATFLPEDVIDGLYKAVELAGLSVASLTLEPIAAIQVAIPVNFRMLNLALVDVGAGTSDICITNDGSILAYDMIPIAGDCLTEKIAKEYLTDFAGAEAIKRAVGVSPEITYEDIMGLPNTVSSEEVLELLSPEIEKMTSMAAEKIIKCNGGKPVSAVFVVGGGGKIPGYTEMLAEKLGIDKKRSAIRGKEVMTKIVMPDDSAKDSTLVTPLGICLNYYEQNNNFIMVTFNGTKIKLYDNEKLSVVDAALQADFPNENLFPKRGKQLHFFVNGKPRAVRGQLGEAAVIKISGAEGSIYSPIRENDVITVIESTEGEAGASMIKDLPEYSESIMVQVDNNRISVPRYAKVNGIYQPSDYRIQDGDNVEIPDYCTVSQILEFMDVLLPADTVITVNHKAADRETKVFENYLIGFGNEKKSAQSENQTPQSASRDEENVSSESNMSNLGSEAEAASSVKLNVPVVLHVIVNKQPVSLSGKANYVYVDVFDVIDFDLKNPKGNIVTLLNGRKAEFLEPLKEGDQLEIFWE